METSPTTIVVETGGSGTVTGLWAIAFHPDGKHFLGGNRDGIRRWRLTDGQEVGKQTKVDLNAVSVSGDHKWIVCGTMQGACVWDAELQEKVVEVEGTNTVYAVDVSPDSTRFATGTEDRKASVWSITTGERLVGPLRHDELVTGVKFSPSGERIATAYYHGFIRVFDSRNGDQLITIKTIALPSWSPIMPLAWSPDGQQIFAAYHDNKIRSFDASTGSQLVESQTLSSGSGSGRSVALAGNKKFIATYSSESSISFLDTSTLTQIGSIIQDSKEIDSIALSLDNSYLAIGRHDGTIAIRKLNDILPDSYGPFHASTHEEGQQDEQPPTSDGDGDDNDLLELELPSSKLAPQFNYTEPPSPVSGSSYHPRNDEELPPLHSSYARSHSSEALPMTSLSKARPEANLDKVEPSEDIPVLKGWLQFRFKRHSLIARGKRQKRTVGKSVQQQQARRPSSLHTRIHQMLQHKPPVNATAPSDPSKDVPGSGQGSVHRKEAGSPQRANGASQPSDGRVHVTHEPGSSNAAILIRLPAWMLCIRLGSGIGDGTH